MNCYQTTLDQEALLHIEGVDSLKFLQGQTTCDTRPADDGKAPLGAYCTPKGRVVCDFLLCKVSEHHFVLRLRRDILDTAAATFAKYIVFSKAELDSTNQDWQIFACWGDDARRALDTVFGSTPQEAYSSVTGEGFVIVQADTAGTQFECYINAHSHPQLIQQFTSAVPPGTTDAWGILQIEQGLARIEAPTVEEFIPQMLNYDLTGHISFSKGCYTGQEIVARLHYRGTPKRRLYRAQVKTEHPVAIGALLYSAETGKSMGVVVNSIFDSTEQLQSMLIVASVAQVEPGLHLEDQTGPRLSCQSLIPEETSDVAT